MANIPSAGAYMNDIEIAQRKPLTEALHTKIGANINFLLDFKATYEPIINSNTARLDAFGGVSLKVIASGSVAVASASTLAVFFEKATGGGNWAVKRLKVQLPAGQVVESFDTGISGAVGTHGIATLNFGTSINWVILDNVTI